MWLADISSMRAAHVALLNDIEQRRRERYLRDDDKARFTVGVALTRLLVGREIGALPERVRVDRTCPGCSEQHGKPRIVDADVHVSISHSGTKVALALTREAAVGVDVEAVTDRDMTDLLDSVLTPAEPVHRRDDFYRYWCRKEAVIKATGEGLRVPLREVIVSPADEPARLVAYRGGARDCALADLPTDRGYAGAVALLAAGELRVQVQDASVVLG